MSKATGKNKPAAAAKPDEAKPEGDKAAKTAKLDKGTNLVIPIIKSGALSVDVGPKVIAGMFESYAKEEQANKLIAEIESKRFDMLATLTSACIKAAKADPTINLAVTFEGDKKKMSLLNDQLGIALGFRVVNEVDDGKGNIKKSISYAPAVTKFLPGAKEDKNTEDYKRKNTVRSNFLHMLKKCAQAASGAVASGVTVKTDTKTGTLQISGPAVTKQFGKESVLLNDKITVGEGDKAVKLKEKPSFTALGRMGAEAAGKTLATRKDSRVASNAVDPDTALQSICATLVQAIGKLKEKPIAKSVESLKSVQNAIAKVLA